VTMASAQQFAAASARHFPTRPSPIGMARVAVVPAGVPSLDAPAASACAFWRQATDRLFAVGAEHGNCAVGRVTQGFAASLPADDVAVAAMLEVAYLDASEVADIPTLPMGHAAIVYGPLRRFPLDAEAVLVLATPRQAMLICEALGMMRAGAGGVTVTGRPTCMAIPSALADGRARGSLACTGARVYAGLADDEMLLVIPAARLDGLADRLDHIMQANAAVSSLAGGLLAEVTAGG
jgi:uncharacterized protein (DUF169 family)